MSVPVYVCFSVKSEGPNFYRSQSTTPTDGYLLAMSKRGNAVSFEFFGNSGLKVKKEVFYNIK